MSSVEMAPMSAGVTARPAPDLASTVPSNFKPDTALVSPRPSGPEVSKRAARGSVQKTMRKPAASRSKREGKPKPVIYPRPYYGTPFQITGSAYLNAPTPAMVERALVHQVMQKHPGWSRSRIKSQGKMICHSALHLLRKHMFTKILQNSNCVSMPVHTIRAILTFNDRQKTVDDDRIQEVCEILEVAIECLKSNSE